MTRRLRIVSVCRTLPTPTDPSAGVFVLNRLRAMSRRADVAVVQPIPYLPGVKPLPKWAAEPRTLHGVTVIHAPMLYVPGVLKSADGAWLALAIAGAIERLHAQSPIDLIDAHFGYPEGPGCVRIAERLSVPLFVTIRGVENEYVQQRGIGHQMLSAMRRARGCISVSHSLREVMVRHGIAAANVRVIHNAIDASVFRPGDALEARASIGVPDDLPLVVSVGHLVSRKRHHVLIDAFARVKREHPSACLAVIGARAFETQYPDSLRALASSLGVEPAVRFIENVPPSQVAQWLRAADVFALATAREGCCNAVLEALASGAPVVTTPAGDNAHFVAEDENGYLVPVDDADALARAMDRALRKSWDRPRIAARLANQVGDWDGVAARVLEFMEERLGATSSLQ